jgi:hypothetical protein
MVNQALYPCFGIPHTTKIVGGIGTQTEHMDSVQKMPIIRYMEII